MSSPDWLKSSETLSSVLGIILGVIGTTVTEGEAAVLIGITLGMIEAGMIQATPQLISQSLASGAGVAVPAAFDSFVATAASPVAWMRDASFRADTVTLGDALLFAGQLTSPT